MTQNTIIAIVILVIGILLLFAHYKFKVVRKHKMLETGSHAGGIALVVLALITLVFPFSQQQYFKVTKSASVSAQPSTDRGERRSLAEDAAEMSARGSLAMTVESYVKKETALSGGTITENEVRVIVGMALKAAEVVSGEYLPDERYEITMRVPKPKVES